MGSLLSLPILELFDLAQKQLERSVDSQHRSLAAWTLLVAIGLMLEYGPDLARLCGKKTLEKDPYLWMRVYAFIGPILITAGVAGELFVGAQFGLAEVQLRSFGDSSNAQLRKTASEANERASAADLARVQLEKSLEWRTLSKKQASAICAALIPLFPGSHLAVASSSFDPESWEYAQQFAEMLVRCHDDLTPTGAVGTLPFPHPIEFGILITVRGNAVDRGNILRRILESNGIPVLRVDPDRTANATMESKYWGLTIFVCPRPSLRRNLSKAVLP